MAVLFDFNPKKEGGPEKPTPSHILELAAKLGKSSMDDEIACVLKAAAAAELECLKNSTANRCGIVNLLQTRGDLLPLVIAEI